MPRLQLLVITVRFSAACDGCTARYQLRLYALQAILLDPVSPDAQSPSPPAPAALEASLHTFWSQRLHNPKPCSRQRVDPSFAQHREDPGLQTGLAGVANEACHAAKEAGSLQGQRDERTAARETKEKKKKEKRCWAKRKKKSKKIPWIAQL